MENRFQWLTWGLPLIVVGSFLYFAFKQGGLSWPPSLDFTGGARLEYQIDKNDGIRKGIETSDEKQEALQRIQEVFLFRLRSFDLSEIIVKPLGDDRIVVEVPGTGAIDRVKGEIGSASVLTFRLLREDDSHDLQSLSQLPEAERKNYFRFADGRVFFRLSQPLLQASDILYKQTRVELSQPTMQNPKKEPFIRLALRDTSKTKFAQITNQYYQQRLAICLDQTIVSAPVVAAKGIREPIISGGFTMTEANELTKILRAGPLPVSLELVAQSLVSPNLRKETYNRGLIAVGVGIGFVILILGLAYADHLALLITFGICITLEALLLFMFGQNGWITLNMVSLSGLVVLLGISVDNLILIFEEFRNIQAEERAFSGQQVLSSLNKAFKEEMGIIILANITTVVTILPLYFLEGPIKDLVKVMFLGIIAAVLTNVWYTRRLLAKRELVLPLEDASPSHRPLFSVHFDIFSLSRPLSGVYLIAVVLSGFLLINRGLEEGLDFKGGAEIKLLSDQGISTENLRAYALDYFGERCEIKKVTSQNTNEFQYIVRVPTSEKLLAETSELVSTQPQISGLATAEGFLKNLQVKEPVSIRLASIDSLGPTVVALNRTVVIFSIIGGLLTLTLFIGFKYGLGYTIPVIVALILDALIVLGSISFFGVPVSIPVIAAVLTIVGYSINDSIVICGHIHRGLASGDKDFSSILRSLSSRVVLTSLTTAGVAASIWYFGRELIRDFGAVITLGVIFGTISSLSLVTVILKYFHSINLIKTPTVRKSSELLGTQTRPSF